MDLIEGYGIFGELAVGIIVPIILLGGLLLAIQWIKPADLYKILKFLNSKNNE